MCGNTDINRHIILIVYYVWKHVCSFLFKNKELLYYNVWQPPTGQGDPQGEQE